MSKSRMKPQYCRAMTVIVFVLFCGLFSGLYFVMTGERESRYDDLILRYSLQNGLSPALVKALIWKESRFRPKARGTSGEIGLMQLMPIAVEEWSNRTKSKKPAEYELYRPEVNIEIGTWYLGWTGRHWKDYKSGTVLQLSEYNAGYGNVTKRWKPKSPDTEVKLSDITIRSTQAYIREILDKSKEYEKDFIAVQKPTK